MRIGIDFMGGEQSPLLLFQAILDVVEKVDSNVELYVLALPSIVKELESFSDLNFPISLRKVVRFIVAEDLISMEDSPLLAVRRKKKSTLAEGVRLLKEKFLDAFVSTGNTGALVAYSSILLPMLPGIERPALLAFVPSIGRPVSVLDVGASTQNRWKSLVQYSFMGAAHQRCCNKVKVPRVGLLNIGTEPIKGTEEIRRAYKELKAYSTEHPEVFSFLGNVEGREVFQGKVDVLVTNGFAGNVFLKTSEGVSSFVFNCIEKEFPDKSPEKLQDILNFFSKYLVYEQYSGAILCGVDALIIKCHGHSSPKALANAILNACDLQKDQFLLNLKEFLSSVCI